MPANYEMNKTTKRGWTKQPNAILTDKGLTSDAKIIIYFLLSITGDYNISLKGISKIVNLSESKVKRAVELLQDTGYLKIVKIRNGKFFGGYKWLISDVPGVYRKCADGISMDGISKDGISIPATSMYENSNHGISIHENSMDAPLYQYTERYQQTNNQERIDKQTEENQLPHHQAQAVEEEEVSLPPYPDNISLENSSGEQVISPLEFKYQQFLKKYPKAPLDEEREETRKVFFEIPDVESIFEQIMYGLDKWCNSAEWRKNEGQYIKKPMKWLKERQWEKISHLMSFSERMNALFPDEED